MLLKVVNIYFLLIVVYISFVECVTSLQNDTTIFEDKAKGPGKPLFLTPYIEQGRLKEGRIKSAVEPFLKNVKSYAGYLTINKQYNSNMFFWYFESENNPKTDPTVVWLQGGPGSSGLFGLFMENGPYMITRKKLYKRKHTWSKICNIVYFDNPTGTGYSFTDDDLGYATNETKVGADLYEALIQLLKLFPTIQKNNLFLTGESYAGKYIPALGQTIHQKNKDHPDIFVNLKGLMIGNGFTDPKHMLKYSKYLYQAGLIDENAMKKIQQKESLAVYYIKHRRWREASDLFNRIIVDGGSLYFKYTGLDNYFNYYKRQSGFWYSYDEKFVTSDLFRRRVHVGDKTYHNETDVYNKLHDDMAKSVIDWVANLLNHYRVLFYNGQLDVVCAYPLTVSYLKNMKWPLRRAYKTAKRHRYKVNGSVAGYYKSVGNLTEVLVRNAGHMVPADQPLWMLQLLKDFINDSISPLKEESESNRSNQ